jgi:hypothetical protein
MYITSVGENQMSGSAINRTEQKVHVSYNSKIDSISTYFGVSGLAAKYMYHLRRKGFPYKKPDQQDFLPWTLSLQNALVRADTHESFDWETIQFGEELNTLMRHGIEVVEHDHRVLRNEVTQANASKITNKTDVDIDDDGGGWTVVVPKNKFLAEKHILRSCGLLPSRVRKPRDKKKNDNTNDGNDSNPSENAKSCSN